LIRNDYDAIAIETGVVGKLDSSRLLADQALNNKNLKWVHSFTAGIDAFVKYPEFANADHVPLTNARSCFGHNLAEFVLMTVISECKMLRQM